jgi:hypothetical protein
MAAGWQLGEPVACYGDAMIYLNLIALTTSAAYFGIYVGQPVGTPYRRFWIAWGSTLAVLNGAIVAVAL